MGSSEAVHDPIHIWTTLEQQWGTVSVLVLTWPRHVERTVESLAIQSS